MLRNFSRLNMYLNMLLDDVYPQPTDAGHTKWANQVFEKWFMPNGLGESVLDVGCGDTAFMKSRFESVGMKYTGVAVRTINPEIVNADFSFLDFDDNSFDVIFSRHSLEHSPMPIITLMEWNRVSSHLLCLILPNPITYGWAGRNHYSMLHPDQVEFLLNRSGWHIIWTDFSEESELRYMCEKVQKSEYGKYKNE